MAYKYKDNTSHAWTNYSFCQANLGLTEENKNDVLLPPTGEFVFHLPLDEAVRVEHMRDPATGAPQRDTCELLLVVKRNAAVFVFRTIVTTVIVVLGSIVTALFMHPDDHAGDREAVLFIAFLITVTNIQTTETGLGKVTTLLWLDLFN